MPLVFTRILHGLRRQESITQRMGSSSSRRFLSSFSTEEDTIFALSSGSNENKATAISVIRLSGEHSSTALQYLLLNKNMPKPRYASLRTLHDPVTQEPLDSSLVIYFPKPNSFTGEDMVELHTHGSQAVVSGVFQSLSSMNLPMRPADPGEFTYRAFRNGKMDMLQVEALQDLLNAQTKRQRTLALSQMNRNKGNGSSNTVYWKWRDFLIKGLAHAEAIIDFGDDEHLLDDDLDGQDDLSQQDFIWGNLRHQIKDLIEQMQLFLGQDYGEIIRSGLRIGIIGPPNAGKSSLLNNLAKREVAIVSPIAGTTRDVLEVYLDLSGYKCIIQDTAGLYDQTDLSVKDIIEKEGIARSVNVAKNAHVILCLLDVSDISNGINAVNHVLLHEETESKRILYVANKIDLLSSSSTNFHEITKNLPYQFQAISCRTDQGMQEFLQQLTEAVSSRVSSSSTDDIEESTIITRERHRYHVQNALSALQKFEQRSKEGLVSVDLAAEELRLASNELGQITGVVDIEHVLDVLFSDFCIGK